MPEPTRLPSGAALRTAVPFARSSQATGSFGATRLPAGSALKTNTPPTYLTVAAGRGLARVPAGLHRGLRTNAPFLRSPESVRTVEPSLNASEAPYRVETVAPSTERRPPGDYLVRYAFRELAGPRELVYIVPGDVSTGVIRGVLFSNSSNTSRTVRVWLANFLVVPSLIVPANDHRGEDLSGWQLKAGERIEIDPGGTGVVAYLNGVEEVA